MELNGLKATKKNIRALGEMVDRNGAQALNLVAQPRVRKMKDRSPVDPVDGGSLKASIHLSPVKRTKRGLEVYWQAGGPASAYALIQHENMAYKHTTGQAKFISSVVYEDAAAMRSELAKEFSKFIKMGGTITG